MEAGVSHVFQPRYPRRCIRLPPLAIVDWLHCCEAKCGPIEVGSIGLPAHHPRRVPPSPGGAAHDGFHRGGSRVMAKRNLDLRGVGISIDQSVEEDVGIDLVPEGLAGGGSGKVEHQALAIRIIVELRLHQHPVPAGLRGFIGSRDRGAKHRRHAVDGLATVSGGSDIGRHPHRLRGEVRLADVDPTERQKLTLAGRVKDQRIVRQRDGPPVGWGPDRRSRGHRLHPTHHSRGQGRPGRWKEREVIDRDPSCFGEASARSEAQPQLAGRRGYRQIQPDLGPGP